MATMAVYCYLTFPTTYDAIRAEKLLQQKSYPFKMVPVPRSISSSCGTALRCACSDSRAIKDYLVSLDVAIEGRHEVEEKELRLPNLFRPRGRNDHGN